MFARTPRLLLRPGWREDAGALERAIDATVTRNTSRMPSHYTRADAEAFLATPPARLPNLLILERTAGGPRLIGGISLSPDRDEANAVELGYWITPPAQRRGFATEAGRAVIGMAEALGIHRLTACHFTDNPASGRVLAKLGFVPQGCSASRFSRARDALVPSIQWVREVAIVTTSLAA